MSKLYTIVAWIIVSTALILAEGESDKAGSLPELKEARLKCQTRMTQLWEDYHEETILLRSRYLDALAKLESDLKKAGKPDGLRAVQNEKKYFSKSKNWDKDKHRELAAHVLPTFDFYAKSAQQLDSTYDGQCKALNQAYRAYLEKLKTSLTINNRIPEAILVKQELDNNAGVKPILSPSPPLPEGKTAANITTPAQLSDHLNQTRWKLIWRSGEVPQTQTEQIEFRFGNIFRFIGADGEVQKYKYSIGDDLSVKIESRRGKSLVFDPSFTVFEYSDEYYRIYRRGYLVGSLDAEEPASLTSDLVLYLPFDEVAEYLRDYSANSNHAKVHKASVVFYGKKNNACQFDGKNSIVEVRKPIDPDDYEAFSVSLWIQALSDVVSSPPIFMWEKDGEHGGFYLRRDKGRFTFRFGSGHTETYVSRIGECKAHEWYHIVMAHSRDGGNMFYVNGELLHSHPAMPLKNNDTTLSIGGYKPDGQNGEYFHGLIDDFMVFKRTLTPDEVKRIRELRAFKIVTKSDAKTAETE